MNERIQELAEHAVRIAHGELYDNQEYHVLIKARVNTIFAELIIRECISRCEGNGEYKNHNSEWGQGLAAGIELCKETIKQHFGVEE